MEITNRPQIVDIYLERGDTLDLSFIRRDFNDNPLPTPHALYFTVKNSENDEEFLLQKKLNDGITVDDETGKVTINLTKDDTNNFHDTLIYDCEVITETYCKTLLKGIIDVDKDVTTPRNEG